MRRATLSLFPYDYLRVDVSYIGITGVYYGVLSTLYISRCEYKRLISASLSLLSTVGEIDFFSWLVLDYNTRL